MNKYLKKFLVSLCWAWGLIGLFAAIIENPIYIIIGLGLIAIGTVVMFKIPEKE